MKQPIVATAPWLTLGTLIAFLVLVIDIVFMVLGTVDLKIGLLIAGLAVAVIL